MSPLLKQNLKLYLIGSLILIAVVSILAIVTLNLTFTYPIISRHYNLDVITGFDHDTLLYNYRQIIHYLNFPWVRTLVMPDFPMSATGEFHFWEVKVIFHVLHVISLLFVACLFIAIKKKKPLLSYFNAAANLAFMTFGSVLIVMLLNFNFAFYWFHRVFFNNDYWIFDATTDPIILALPGELFMIKGVILIALLFFIGAVSKILYKRKSKTP